MTLVEAPSSSLSTTRAELHTKEGLTGSRTGSPKSRWDRRFVALSLRMSMKLQRRGWVDSALTILQKLAALYPQALIVRVRLARMALAAGDDTTAAQAVCEEAVDHLPDIGLHRHRIAAIHLGLEDLAAADRYLMLAKESNPQSAILWRLSGMMFRMRGNVDSAVRSYEECARLEPTKRLKIQAMKGAAATLADAGRKDVEFIYRQILDLDPEDTFAYYGLVECQRHVDRTDPVVQTIHQLAASRSIQTSSKSNLHYALAIVHDKCGDYGAAIAHLMVANRIRASESSSFNISTRQADADNRRTVFTGDFITERGRHGCQDDVLVCVVGMPRSGTSLVEQILGSHSEVRPLGERNDFSRLAATLPRFLRTRTKFPECCRELTPRQIKETSRMILDRLRRTAGPCQRIVTKLPEDFLNLGLIKILFPKVRIIHCQRNPLDTCLSCYQQNFKHIPYARDLYDLTAAYQIYRQMMQHWKQSLPDSSILALSYENLVGNPETVMRGMFDFVGLEFQNSCLEFHRSEQLVKTMSRWQVRQPIYQTSANRSAPYREFLGPLLELEDQVDDSTPPAFVESGRIAT